MTDPYTAPWSPEMKEVTKTFFETEDGKLHESQYLAQLHEATLQLTTFLCREYGGLEEIDTGVVAKVCKKIVDNRREIRTILFRAPG